MLTAGLSLLAACGGSGEEPTFNNASEVYAALVNRLEQEDKVLHATVISTQSDTPEPNNLEFWIDEARDLAREHQDQAYTTDWEIFIIDAEKYTDLGNGQPSQSEAPSCEGVTAPATSLLLRCEGVAGSRTELVESESGTLQIETTGSYGADIGNKPWTLTLTLDADSLMPLTLDSNLWGVLNDEPYEVNGKWAYTTELVEREDLPADLFELE
jgi:hypothetical protein